MIAVDGAPAGGEDAAERAEGRAAAMVQVIVTVSAIDDEVVSVTPVESAHAAKFKEKRVELCVVFLSGRVV